MGDGGIPNRKYQILYLVGFARSTRFEGGHGPRYFYLSVAFSDSSPKHRGAKAGAGGV